MPAQPGAARAAILRAAVAGGGPAGVPVTAKFRMGLRDDLLTYLHAGRIAEAEGSATSPCTPAPSSSTTPATPGGRPSAS